MAVHEKPHLGVKRVINADIIGELAAKDFSVVSAIAAVLSEQALKELFKAAGYNNLQLSDYDLYMTFELKHKEPESDS